jgi:hypothetical protein
VIGNRTFLHVASNVVGGDRVDIGTKVAPNEARDRSTTKTTSTVF